MAPPKPKPLMRLLQGIVSHTHVLTLILWTAGIVGLLFLPLSERKIKFDEKALIAGASIPSIRYNSTAALLSAQTFMAQAKPRVGSPQFAGWLVAQLRLSGNFEVYVSSHTALPRNGRLAAGLNCTNVHAVLRSPRGDGKESIVLVTPAAMHANAAGLATQTAGGTALGLGAVFALLHHLASLTWVAKDVVWVIPDAACGSTNSLLHWSRAYQTPAKHERHVRDLGRAGIMQQAMVLEVVHDRFDTAEVLVEGYDGQLPKLDSFQLLKFYAEPRLFVPLAVRDRWRQPHWPARLLAGHQGAEAYASRVLNMLHFMWQQAKGLPTGPHAAFKEVMVDAATLRLTQLKAQASSMDPAHSLVHLAEVLEVALRSLNNLIERFHHSSFLYLLTDTEHFVTVEMYIVPLITLLLCLVLQAAFARDLAAPRAPPSSSSSKEGSGGDLASWPDAIRSTLLLYGSTTAAGLLIRRAAGHASAGAAGRAHLSTRTASSRGLQATLVDMAGAVLGSAAAAWHRLCLAASQQASVGAATGAGDLAGGEGGVLGTRGAPETVALAACVATLVVCCLPELLGYAARRAAGEGEGDGTPDGSIAWAAGREDAPAAALGGKEQLVTQEQREAGRLQRRAVALSLAAVALSALACINWALAYAISFVLVPLAAATCPLGPPALTEDSAAAATESAAAAAALGAAPAAGDVAAAAAEAAAEAATQAAAAAAAAALPRRRLTAVAVRLLAGAILSPPALLLLLHHAASSAGSTGAGAKGGATAGRLWGPGAASGWPAWASLLFDSRGTTYLLLWAVYVPTWIRCLF